MILYYTFETAIEESEVGGGDPDDTLTTDLVESSDHLIQHCLATLGDQLWTSLSIEKVIIGFRGLWTGEGGRGEGGFTPHPPNRKETIRIPIVHARVCCYPLYV